MGDLQRHLEAAGFQDSTANEAVEKEKQRILSLLSNPATKFRLSQDYNYQYDSRLNPESADHKPFQDVLMADWEELVSNRKANDETHQVSEASLEQEWLSPITREEIEKALQEWIDGTSKLEEKKDLIDYKQKFLGAVNNYEKQQAGQEFLRAPIAPNSRLYRDFFDDYNENKNGVQERYANVDDYLYGVLADMQKGNLPLPAGCKSPADVLNPFWQSQTVETKNHNQVFLGSRLGLEYGARFYDNPESRLLLHVAENLPAKQKRFSGADLESVSLGEIYNSLSDYIRQAAERLEDGESNLPEGAESLADAIKPLSREEVEQWLEEQGIDNRHPLMKFLSTGVMVPEQMPVESEVEVGSEEDMAHHQERWQRQASRSVNYNQPPNSGDVEVPRSVAQEFGYKEGNLGMEGRTFRAEVAANLRELKFEPLRQDGVLRLSCTVDVNEQGTLRPKNINIYINLPKEAMAAYGEDPGAVQQILADLLKTNESSKHPDLVYNSQADRLEIGLGDDAHLNVIVSMSTKDMRQALPQLADEINDYVVRKQAARLTPDERQKMWRFENELLKIWQKNSNGQEVELRQKIWDEAFLKLFRQKIGESRFAELGSLSGQSVSEPSSVRQESRSLAGENSAARPVEVRRVTNRLREARENMDSPEMRQKAKVFLDTIKAEYGGWEEFLQYAGNVLDIAHRQSVGLNSAPAYIILGNEILSAPQRALQLAEYERLSRLSLDEIQKHKLISLPEGGKVNKPNVLRRALWQYITENTLPSDKWEKSVQVAENKRPDNRNIRQEPLRARPANVERQPTAKDNHSDVIAKILARAKKRVANKPYNPDSDPEVQAGII